MKFSIRLLYLYLFSFVGLLIVVIGGIQMVDLGIKTFVFKDADKYENYPMSKVEGEPEIDVEEMKRVQAVEQQRQKQRQLSNSLAMILIGAPLYAFHWKTIQKENKE